MKAIKDSVALITGASSGIGRETALRLAEQGARLALVARTRQTLEAVAEEVARRGGQALVLPTDVTCSQQSGAAVARTVEVFGQLDCLICSAGVSMRCQFEGSSLDAIEQVMRVNFFGTLYATHHAIPHLKASQGSLIAVSSLVGKRGTPTYAVYGASKSAVHGLYESLRLELASAGVHVGIVSPGHVATPLRDRVLAGDGKPWETPPPVPFRVWPVEMVVDRILQLLNKRKAEAILPSFVRMLLALDQLLGPWLGDRIISRQFRKNPLPESCRRIPRQTPFSDALPFQAKPEDARQVA